MIAFDCPWCNMSLTIDDDFAGQQTSCPRCSKAFMIPAIEQPAIESGFPVISRSSSYSHLVHKRRGGGIGPALCSLIFCGLGQIINGRTMRGVFLFLACVGIGCATGGIGAIAVLVVAVFDAYLDPDYGSGL